MNAGDGAGEWPLVFTCSDFVRVNVSCCGEQDDVPSANTQAARRGGDLFILRFSSVPACPPFHHLECATLVCGGGCCLPSHSKMAENVSAITSWRWACIEQSQTWRLVVVIARA